MEICCTGLDLDPQDADNDYELSVQVENMIDIVMQTKLKMSMNIIKGFRSQSVCFDILMTFIRFLNSAVYLF